MNLLTTKLPGTTTTASGIRTHYYEAGSTDAETLILLHGMSASADTFRDLMAAFSNSYRVIAPDIPGFGYSENANPYSFPRLTAWLKEFVGELGLESAHLAGHSFGGALAVSYALAEAEDVRSLILLAPSVLRPGKYPQWLRKFAQSRFSEWILEVGVNASRIMLQRQMRAAFYDPTPFDVSLWERRRRDYENSRASAAVLRASAMHDIRPELRNIRQQSCIIWGRQDPVLEPADAMRLNELMPQSRTQLHLLPECGHIPHIEQEGQVIEIVEKFLAVQ